MIALSKTLDPADFDQLAPELEIVDRWFTSAREQHPMRRWEYAMALRARRVWLQWDYDTHGHADRAHGHRIHDVGGAGSPFRAIVSEDAGQYAAVIDPDEEPHLTLQQYLRFRGGLAHEVYCLSVLEHIDDLGRFLYHLDCLVAPGGLLFLTMDCCGCQGHDAGDPHHFHWMRQQIFTLTTITGLVHLPLAHRGYRTLDDGFGRDLAYHGDHVFDYSFASLALVKRR